LGNKYNGNTALLASLTTLYIAIKLYDTKKIKLSTLANLSRGQFNSNDIEIMEWTVLSALQWKLHPPTPYAFVEYILFFLPSEVGHTIRTGLNEVSKYLTELAVCDAYFVDRAHSSTIAFAAILTVMEDINYWKFSGSLREAFLQNLACQVNLHHQSNDVVNARKRLRKMYTNATIMNASDVNCVTPQQNSPTSPGQENCYVGVCGDTISLADRSMLSGSALSISNQNYINTSVNSTYRSSCANSVDTSKSGSCRYSQKPSPRRTNFFASVSPIITSSRAGTTAATLIESGIQ
jgi:Cyclin, N-terminal domain/Cyclin, C-terminal domain